MLPSLHTSQNPSSFTLVPIDRLPHIRTLVYRIRCKHHFTFEYSAAECASQDRVVDEASRYGVAGQHVIQTHRLAHVPIEPELVSMTSWHAWHCAAAAQHTLTIARLASLAPMICSSVMLLST